MSAQGCIASGNAFHRVNQLPDWVPVGARVYLSHVASGRSLRALARDHGCHASTILRQVRRLENRRDDPLVDEALRRLDQSLRMSPKPKSGTESRSMLSQPCNLPDPPTSTDVAAQAMRYLHELTAPTAVLVVAADMENAIVTCRDAEGILKRVAILDRHLAEAMALMEWITCRTNGRPSTYILSPAGRAVLRSFQEGAGGRADPSFENEDCAPRRVRYGIIESPVTVLARRRDKAGQPFLDAQLVQAAERLREDFVMAQLDSVQLDTALELIGALESRKVKGSNVAPPGTKAARMRVLEAFRDLGPGLGDVALRCCCRLEGVESAENALGWSARSGKIVLRIALQRLSWQYQRFSEDQMMIG